jgi:WS/DGAT/MGAT family acyltransferase
VPQLGRLQNQIRRQTISPPTTTIPRTRWSGPASAHRVFDGVRFDLDAMKSIKHTLDGATVNDVVLTIVGGALRTYLLFNNELQSDPLIAMAPISVRSEDERGAAGNLVSGMFVTLGTNIADPRARLEAVRESTHSQKEFMNAVGARTLVDFAELLPGGLVGLGARTAGRLSLANRTRPIFNATVTNMPGPQHPLYMAGAKCVAQYGVGMIVDGMGLIHPVISYCGEMTIAFTSDREMMPDPAFYAQCLQQSFDELAAATIGTTNTSAKAPAKRAAPRRSTRKANTRSTTRKRPAPAATV